MLLKSDLDVQQTHLCLLTKEEGAGNPQMYDVTNELG